MRLILKSLKSVEDHQPRTNPVHSWLFCRVPVFFRAPPPLVIPEMKRQIATESITALLRVNTPNSSNLSIRALRYAQSICTPGVEITCFSVLQFLS